MAKPILTEQRARLLSEILISDKDRATKLLELSADEAMRKINDLGHDFTLDEIRSYGEIIVYASQMSDDALENVAGGADNGHMEENIPPLLPVVIPAAKIFGKGLFWGGASAVALRVMK